MCVCACVHGHSIAFILDYIELIVFDIRWVPLPLHIENLIIRLHLHSWVLSEWLELVSYFPGILFAEYCVNL